MNSFQCYYYRKLEKKEAKAAGQEFQQNGNNACWAGIRSWMPPNSDKYEILYVDKFKHKATEKYVELLVNTINEITPCGVTKDGKYITFELFGTYDQSLVMLNFLRNLWFEYMPGYAKSFFECLEGLEEGDALERLTTANIKACTDVKMVYQGNHCNCHAYGKLKVKSIKDLLAYKGLSTYQFLTT